MVIFKPRILINIQIMRFLNEWNIIGYRPLLGSKQMKWIIQIKHGLNYSSMGLQWLCTSYGSIEICSWKKKYFIITFSENIVLFNSNYHPELTLIIWNVHWHYIKVTLQHFYIKKFCFRRKGTIIPIALFNHYKLHTICICVQ